MGEHKTLTRDELLALADRLRQEIENTLDQLDIENMELDKLEDLCARGALVVRQDRDQLLKERDQLLVQQKALAAEHKKLQSDHAEAMGLLDELRRQSQEHIAEQQRSGDRAAKLAGLLREALGYADPHGPFSPNERRDCVNRFDAALAEWRQNHHQNKEKTQ